MKVWPKETQYARRWRTLRRVRFAPKVRQTGRMTRSLIGASRTAI